MKIKLALLAAAVVLALAGTARPAADTPTPAPTHAAESWDVDTATDRPPAGPYADTPPPWPNCQPLQLDDSNTAEQVDALLAAGWTSRPTDGTEALYAPGC